MRRWLILAAIAIVLIGGLSLVLSQGTQAQAIPQTQTPTTIAVTRGNVQQAVTADAKLVDVKQATLSMGASGQLAAINIRPGDNVHAGDVLAALDTTDLQQQVDQAEQAYLLQQATYSATLQPDPQAVTAARAAVNSAQSAYTAAQQKSATSQDQITVACIDVQNAADALGRTRDAYQAIANDLRGWMQAEVQARKAAYQAAQHAYDAEVAQCDLARNTVNDSSVRSAQANLSAAQKTLSNLIAPTNEKLIAAKADLELARLALKRAQMQLARATVVAPFDGVVLSVNAKVGDQINANAALIVIADPKALQVEASVAEVDLPLVQIGQSAQLLFDARPDITATGRVDRIVPERSSGTSALYPVYITFDDLPTGLVADMTTDAYIIIAQRSNVLRLPRSLVHAQANNTAQVNVWVNDHIESRSVTTGLRGDLYVEITSGLNEGDQVVSQ